LDNKISQERLLAASESLAPRFSWQLNAAVYRFGLLCDIIFASVCCAVMCLVWALVVQLRLPVLPRIFSILSVLPIVACVVANFKARNARDEVVRWIASQPFPVDGVTAVLAGAGESFEVFFADTAPSRDTIMACLERVSEDVFVTESEEGAKSITARFGIVDGKHNQLKGPQSRYVRMKAVVEQALVPLHAEHPIVRVLLV